ncbi:hypothetical protein QYF36_026145 [Acer negundo]|nr:hypothetical protein QYF36_018152 [Acer negundo]KAK4841111.1 hypothetical protein QYF36_026145 [Acer negundo]
MANNAQFFKYSFCKKARFHFSPSKDGCKVKKCGVHLVYSELEDESTKSTRGGIAKEDREDEYFDSESEVINTLCSRLKEEPK